MRIFNKQYYCYIANCNFITSSFQRELDSTGCEMESDLVSASSGGSMSDYGSDLEDLELELRRDKTRPSLPLARPAHHTPADRIKYKR